MYNSVNDLCNYLVWLRVGVLANLGGNTLFRNPGSSKVFDIPLGGYAGNYDDNCNNYEHGGVSKAKEERCTCSKRGVRQKKHFMTLLKLTGAILVTIAAYIWLLCVIASPITVAH